MAAMTRLVRRVGRTFFLVGLAVLGAFAVWSPARSDDGYDQPFAKAVRSATDLYRLQLWAGNDGYVQSTDYLANLGIMFTNHDRFSPQDLAHPTVLIFDQAGRLVACEYQFLEGAAVPAAFKNVPAYAWFDIPRHLHYNVRANGRTYYAQAEWPGNDAPTAENIRKHGLMPDSAALLFAFVHPKTRALLVWAWLPNVDGLYAGENALLP
jgi:hypothetical protein